MNSISNSLFKTTLLHPWLVVISTFEIAKYPIGALLDITTEFFGIILAEQFCKPFLVTVTPQVNP